MVSILLFDDDLSRAELADRISQMRDAEVSFNSITTSHTFEQFQRLRDTMMYIQAEERAMKISYDFVIRVRPDL